MLYIEVKSNKSKVLIAIRHIVSVAEHESGDGSVITLEGGDNVLSDESYIAVRNRIDKSMTEEV